MKTKPSVFTVDELDYFSLSPRKEWSFGIIKAVSFLLIFMVDTVLGLSISAHFNIYLTSQAKLFFPKITYTTNCDKECMGQMVELVDNVPISCMSTNCSTICPLKMNGITEDVSSFAIAIVIPKQREEPPDPMRHDYIEFLVAHLERTGLIVETVVGISDVFIKLAVLIRVLGRAATELGTKKLTYIGNWVVGFG